MSRPQDRVDELPAPLAKTVRQALAHENPADRAVTELWEEVLSQLGWPDGDGMIPLASQLTPAQRAVAEILAARPGTFVRRWIPRPSWSKRRWLGLERGGALERNRVADEPLWRALHRVREDSAGMGRILATLPLAERLEALCEMGVGAYCFDRSLYFVPWGRIEDIGDHGRSWAPAFADFLLDIFRPGVASTERIGDHGPDVLVRQIVSICLVRCQVPLEPRWDPLLILSEECMRALPEPRRTRAILASVASMFPDEVIATALSLLPSFPSLELTRLALDRSGRGHRPQASVLSELEAAAGRHAVVRRELDAFRAALAAAPALRCRRAFSPGSAEELTPSQRDQVVIAGLRYDRRELPAEQRVSPDGAEAFYTLEIREIVDARGKPAYDALICNGDSGSIFRAGTSEEVAAIVQHSVECADAPLREGLKAALAAAPRARSGGRPKRKTTPAKKPRRSS